MFAAPTNRGLLAHGMGQRGVYAKSKSKGGRGEGECSTIPCMCISLCLMGSAFDVVVHIDDAMALASEGYYD